MFGELIRPRIRRERSWYQVYLTSTRHHTHGVRNAIAEWLDGLGVFGLRSFEKRVPDRLFEQPPGIIAAFLRHLWSTDGCLGLRPVSNGRCMPNIYYATSSLRLARDVQSLLLRLNITARVSRISQGSKGRDQHHVSLSGKGDVIRFLDQVGALGERRSGKAEAVRLVQVGGQAISQVAKELDLTQSALRSWAERARREKEGGLSADARVELTRLRRENKRLQMEREIPKKSSGALRDHL